MVKKKQQQVETTTATPVAFPFITSELTGVEGLAVQRAFAASKVKEAFEAAVPEGTDVQVDVTVRVQARLRRGQAGSRKATSRALRKATIALLVQRMGVTREAALAVLSDVLSDVQTMSEEAEAALLAAHPEVEQAFEKVEALVEGLPRIPTSGTVTVTEVTIEKVL